MAEMSAQSSVTHVRQSIANARPNFENKMGLPAIGIFFGVLIAGLVRRRRMRARI